MTDKRYAFVASKHLSKHIDELRVKLGLETNAEVISMALSMLELSLGRNVEVKDRKGNMQVNKFADYQPTVEF